MYCYFEWLYRGEVGSSRDYGPMCELDAVGAMQYRQSLGAEITHKEFLSDFDKMCDHIDNRQRLHDIQKNRTVKGWN